EQPDLPPRIGVIGLGPLGAEIAQALARLGLEVHGFDAARRVAGLADPKAAEAARTSLAEDFAVHLETEVELEPSDGGVAIRWDGGNVTVDRVVAVIGRRPDVDGLGLETLGVPVDGQGLPVVAPMAMRIGDRPVLLAGAANGDRPLLHEAADDGDVAGVN